MRSYPVGVAGALLVAATLGCGRFSGAPQPRNDLITREQLVTGDFHTAYDAVEALHANWLESRPLSLGVNAAPPRVVVYLDETRMGNVEELRSISSSSVAYIQHFDGPTATTRWGVGHANGVILVSTHPAPLVSSDTPTAKR